jgi:AcrR family transcriptional regulator
VQKFSLNIDFSPCFNFFLIINRTSGRLVIVKVLDPAAFQIRKETILQHARHLFANKGYAETSMDDLAQACHVQKASLYHYFKGKQELLQQMVDWEVEQWWSTRLKEYESGSNLRETLTIIGTTFLKDMDDVRHQEFFKVIHFESHKNPAILKALKESPTHNRKGFYAVFARHLEGKLPHQKVAMFMTQFMGSLIHYASLSRLRGENMCYEKFEDAHYVDQLVDIFVKGIHAGTH